jgi:pentatricopeptide repeat protein
VGYALFLHDIYHDDKAAIQEMLDFLKINPLNKEALRLLGHLYKINKQYSLSKESIQKIIALDSLFGAAYCELGMVQIYDHQYDQAYANFQKCDRLNPQWSGKTGLIISLVKVGKMNEAKAMVSQMDKEKMSAGARVYMYFAIGEMDQGFEWLEKAYTQGDPIIPQIRDLPSLFPIESDPRYNEMIRKLNFPK